MTLHLKDGKRYKNNLGDVIQVSLKYPGSTFPFEENGTNPLRYMEDGRYVDSGKHLSCYNLVEEDQSMSIDEFIAEVTKSAQKFKEFWLLKHQEEPDKFPLSISDENRGLWWEMFMEFDGDSLEQLKQEYPEGSASPSL